MPLPKGKTIIPLLLDTLHDLNLQDEEVIRLFSDDSTEDTQVKAVRIVRDSATNIGKGFGYVLFSDKNAARMALAKDSFKLQNRPLRVSRVVKMKAKASSEKPGKYSGALGAVGMDYAHLHVYTVRFEELV